MSSNSLTRHMIGWTDPRAIMGNSTCTWGELSLREKVMHDLERSAPATLTDTFIKIRSQVLCMIAEKPIYRILIKGDNSIETDCYDMIDLFKPELDKAYSSIDNLPEWVKERLAVLSILNPNVRNEEIEGVGRRIAKNIFWVYKGEV